MPIPGLEVWPHHQVGDWTGVPGDFARNDPAVSNGMVILGNQAGNNAFWNGSQYVGSGAIVVAVDAATGALKWKSQVEAFPTAMVTSSPVVYNGVVYVGIASAEENTVTVLGTPCCTSRGSIVALDVNTGKILWQTYMVPDNGGKLGGYSGGGIWELDARRRSEAEFAVCRDRQQLFSTD